MNQKSEGDKFKDTVQNSLETISSTMVTLEATLSVQKVILEQLLQKSNAMEINNNWKDLRSQIKTEFMDIAKNLDVSYIFVDGNHFIFRTLCLRHYLLNFILRTFLRTFLRTL